MSRGPLLIVGASGRAAARWARRRGYEPHVIDLFGDVDTCKMAVSVKTCALRNYPKGFVPLALRLPPMPWMYTGGIENDPHIVDEISRHHSLIGNPSTMLPAVRDPFRLQEFLASRGIAFPTSRRVHPGGSVRQLRKPYRSAGGLHISTDTDPHPDFYFQDDLEGTSVSAVFAGATFIGASQQITDMPLHGARFVYAGSCIDRDERRRSAWPRIGAVLAEHFELRGEWGVDGIDVNGVIHLLEINPRYCASRELFDVDIEQRCRIKAIYYAASDMTIPDVCPWQDALTDDKSFADLPNYADIPAAGTVIETGRPVVTLFAHGDTEAACRDKIHGSIRLLDTLFGATS